MKSVYKIGGMPHHQVIESSIASAVLLSWCFFDPEKSKPKIEEIENWNKELISYQKESDRNPEILVWVRRLKAYGFHHVDDLDLSIAHVVERGYIEGSNFINVSRRLDADLRSKEITESFCKVWTQFYESFTGDQNQFIQDLYESATQALCKISIIAFLQVWQNGL